MALPARATGVWTAAAVAAVVLWVVFLFWDLMARPRAQVPRCNCYYPATRTFGVEVNGSCIEKPCVVSEALKRRARGGIGGAEDTRRRPR